MPYAFDGAKAPSKKRKLATHATVEKTSKKVTTKAKTREVVSQETILSLEEAIVESPKNYNNIVTLLGHFKVLPSCEGAERLSTERDANKRQDSVDKESELAVAVAVSLCRTFCRLMAKGRMVKRKGDLEDERTVVVWLKNIYKEYHVELCALLNHGDAAVQVNCAPRCWWSGWC
jgi:U3 small nucleolar RNA-associated protein 19